MREYLQSTSGRIASLSLALAVIALGLTALAGPEHGLYLIAGAPPFLIVGGIFTIGLAIAAHRRAAMTLTIVLPLVAGPYGAALYAARSLGSGAGLALVAIGLGLFLGTVVKPALRPLERRATAS